MIGYPLCWFSKNVYVAYYYKNNEYIVCYPSLSTGQTTTINITQLYDFCDNRKYIMVSGRKKINENCFEHWSYYNKSVTNDLYLCFFGKPYVNLTYFLKHDKIQERILAKIRNIEMIEALDALEGKL